MCTHLRVDLYKHILGSVDIQRLQLPRLVQWAVQDGQQRLEVVGQT